MDVMVIGRVCIDLYPQQVGVGLAEVSSFSKSIGGSAANVAVAVARHGHDVALVTRTGADAFGEYAKKQLEAFNVDTRWIRPVSGMQSVLTFCEMFPPDHFPITIYRNPTAPDMYLEQSDISLSDAVDVPVLFVTATGLSREPSRAAHLDVLGARGRRSHTILDLDFRAAFWPNNEAATAAISEALDHVTVAVGNREECQVAVGESDPSRAADALLDRGVELAIVKMGGDGVLARTRSDDVVVTPLRVDVVNGLGSGDAFGGALCHGLLNGWGLHETVEFANAAGAILATKFECSSAMPSSCEVVEFLREHETQRR